RDRGELRARRARRAATMRISIPAETTMALAVFLVTAALLVGCPGDATCNCSDPGAAGEGGGGAPGSGGDGGADGTGGTGGELPSCDDGSASDTAEIAEVAAAIGVCDAASLVGGGFALADGTGAPAAGAHAVRPAFGAIAPTEGSAMVMLSTGQAAGRRDTRP